MSLNFSIGRPAPATTRTLLLVEDDEHLLWSMQKLFQEHGWHLLVAKQGSDAIALYTANHRHIDAVLTDYDLPGSVTGLDLVTHIQMRQRGLPCVVVSAHWTEAKRPQDEADANLFYRAKPFGLAAMVALLVEVTGNWQRPAATEGQV